MTKKNLKAKTVRKSSLSGEKSSLRNVGTATNLKTKKCYVSITIHQKYITDKT